MSGRIGVALFGIGRAGMIHLRNLISNHRVALRWLVEVDVALAQQLVEEYHQGDTQVVTPSETQRVFQDPSVRAVIVATPTHTHEDIVRAALKHGKGVFCEKPISDSIDGIRTCFEEAENAGQPLICSFNRRFDPSVFNVFQRVKAGAVGQIQVMKMCSRDSPLPPLSYLKISGGIFHDCAVHDIDAICWVLGEYPESVFSQGIARHQEIAALNDVDTVVIVLRFPSGVLATIDLSREAVYGYDQRMEVFGSEGMLTSNYQHPVAVTAFDNGGTQEGRLKFSFPQRYSESYVEALNHFLNVLEGKEKNDILKEHCLMITHLASACEHSQRTQTLVKINPEDISHKIQDRSS